MMKEDVTGIPTHTLKQGTCHEVSRRAFLKRLQRTAVFVAPVVAALNLTPAKSLAVSP